MPQVRYENAGTIKEFLSRAVADSWGKVQIFRQVLRIVSQLLDNLTSLSSNLVFLIIRKILLLLNEITCCV